MSKLTRHTPETFAACRKAVDEANERGRADWGHRWAPDMLPCDTPCALCRQTAHNKAHLKPARAREAA